MNIGRFMTVRNGFFVALLCFGVSPFHAVATPVHGQADFHIISDAHNGLALFGYDPVAYYTDGKAKEGRPDYVVMQNRLAWRFVSEANMQAFMADPSAYVPAFGGHDATAVSEGRMTTGDPVFFAISAGELVFFRSEESRTQFMNDSAAHKLAFAKWPEVARQHGAH